MGTGAVPWAVLSSRLCLTCVDDAAAQPMVDALIGLSMSLRDPISCETRNRCVVLSGDRGGYTFGLGADSHML